MNRCIIGILTKSLFLMALAASGADNKIAVRVGDTILVTGKLARAGSSPQNMVEYEVLEYFVSVKDPTTGEMHPAKVEGRLFAYPADSNIDMQLRSTPVRAIQFIARVTAPDRAKITKITWGELIRQYRVEQDQAICEERLIFELSGGG